LMQGGLHPDFNIEWYENLLSTLHANILTFNCIVSRRRKFTTSL
jgi:2-iminoacetate synthase ThiH